MGANGDVVHASETMNPDLFWALRGGGGGTFGVVTNITYKTHVAPTLGGYLHGSMICEDAGSFEQLLVAFLEFIPQLFTPHWGDSVTPNQCSIQKYRFRSPLRGNYKGKGAVHLAAMGSNNGLHSRLLVESGIVTAADAHLAASRW